ncbi:hypothetical protein [Luteibacter sp. Lutesp34]|uniref:hypothetical protein n=1 Tax=Luteibacter sp. Lutesp34 TaxID=3243030 RepID=UPI0039B43271
MEKMIRTALVALLMAAPLAAAAQTGSSQAARGVQAGNGAPIVVPGSCGVTDLVSFNQFVAGRPTIPAFQAAYGCLHLVLPGDVTTREIRTDNSRYFAEVDSFGRVVAGYFQ